jgi:CheY-like chemotaxis protein
VSAGPRWGDGPWAPVVIERAGGGLARIAPDDAPLRAIRGLAREAAEHLDVVRTTVWRLGPDGVPARCLTRFHRPTRAHEDDLAYPDELGREAARLLARLSVLAMEDVRSAPTATPALRAYLDEAEVRAILAVPVRVEGQVAGFLAFEETDRPRQWTAADREGASTLAYRLEQHWRRQGRGVGPSQAPHRASGLSQGRGAPVPAGAAPAPETGSAAGSAAQVALPQQPPEPRVPVAGSSAFGHRRELRARLQRLRTLERTGIVGTDAAVQALQALHVQDGTLALLAGRLAGSSLEAELLADARETLDRARAELRRFLDWTRHGPGRAAPLELNALVGDLAVRLGKLTGDRVGLLYAPASEPVVLGAESGLLARALEELVRNARAASVPGDRVRVAVQRTEEAGGRPVARLLVEDRGAGIAAADLPWIFEPWYSTRGEAADGMGLPLVQAVVEGHGGWVDVTSTRGEGSRFALNFPLDRPRVEAATEDVGVEPEAPEPDGEVRPLALLVEDEPMLARLLRRALEGAGFEVRHAEGGAEAGRLLREHGHDAALLVTERVLVDGGEGMALVRGGRAAQPYLAGIVLDRRLRGDADPSVVRRVREASRIPSDVRLLAQPLDPVELGRLARELVEGRAADPDGREPTGDGSAGTLH